nr:hypothetical protein Iba_chr13bCG15090 [Ipomoea batatas]
MHSTISLKYLPAIGRLGTVRMQLRHYYNRPMNAKGSAEFSILRNDMGKRCYRHTWLTVGGRRPVRWWRCRRIEQEQARVYLGAERKAKCGSHLKEQVVDDSRRRLGLSGEREGLAREVEKATSLGYLEREKAVRVGGGLSGEREGVRVGGGLSGGEEGDDEPGLSVMREKGPGVGGGFICEREKATMSLG